MNGRHARIAGGLSAALLVALATGQAVGARPHSVTIELNCSRSAPTDRSSATSRDLSGLWDFLINVNGTPTFGLLSLGAVDGAYAGSLTPASTAPVAVRKLTISGEAVHMEVAFREGDVLFDGKLSPGGDVMCGTVTYHGGRSLPMISRRRPPITPPPQQRQ